MHITSAKSSSACQKIALGILKQIFRTPFPCRFTHPIRLRWRRLKHRQHELVVRLGVFFRILQSHFFPLILLHLYAANDNAQKMRLAFDSWQSKMLQKKMEMVTHCATEKRVSKSLVLVLSHIHFHLWNNSVCFVLNVCIGGCEYVWAMYSLLNFCFSPLRMSSCNLFFLQRIHKFLFLVAVRLFSHNEIFTAFFVYVWQ